MACESWPIRVSAAPLKAANAIASRLSQEKRGEEAGPSTRKARAATPRPRPGARAETVGCCGRGARSMGVPVLRR